ncbi:hypothetical protein AARAC_004644 [Aspergillus arachidicola]|nr:hypothetical protein AARAC_004644 [Aspergillus arachidicola]
MFVMGDLGGITGEFNSWSFKPRKAVIDQLEQDALDSAVQEAEDLFA